MKPETTPTVESENLEVPEQTEEDHRSQLEAIADEFADEDGNVTISIPMQWLPAVAWVMGSLGSDSWLGTPYVVPRSCLCEMDLDGPGSHVYIGNYREDLGLDKDLLVEWALRHDEEFLGDFDGIKIAKQGVSDYVAWANAMEEAHGGNVSDGVEIADPC